MMADRCPNHRMAKGAPLAIIVLCNKTKMTTPLYVEQDLSAATENILLEATHLGLGSVWLGVSPNEERMNNLKEIFGLNDDYYAFSAIIIGYPKNEIIKERKYDDNLVHHNKLGNKYPIGIGIFGLDQSEKDSMILNEKEILLIRGESNE